MEDMKKVPLKLLDGKKNGKSEMKTTLEEINSRLTEDHTLLKER